MSGGPLGALAHRFEPAAGGAAARTLLLLHGTGGDEHDLVALGRLLDPAAALLAPRGTVIENGMHRFFRRHAEGVFDLDDLRERTAELAAFARAASGAYGFDPARLFAAGFSNGANIAAGLLLLAPGTLAGAVLMRAMVPIDPDPRPELPGVPVLMLAGRQDPIVSQLETERLAALLRACGADVTLHWQSTGHALDREEPALARDWLAEVAARAR
jgi:predicted esterase